MQETVTCRPLGDRVICCTPACNSRTGAVALPLLNCLQQGGVHQQVGDCVLAARGGGAELDALTPLIQGRKEADLQSHSQLHAKLCEMQLRSCGRGCSVLPAVLPVEVPRLWAGRRLRQGTFMLTEAGAAIRLPVARQVEALGQGTAAVCMQKGLPVLQSAVRQDAAAVSVYKAAMGIACVGRGLICC